MPPRTLSVRHTVELECAEYLRRHWATIAFVTTIDAPWRKPQRYSVQNIASYCQRMIEALLDPRNTDHVKFTLVVKRYRLAQEVLLKEFCPGGRLEVCASGQDDFYVPQHLRIIKLFSMRSSLSAALMKCRTFGQLRIAYVNYLKALDSYGGFSRTKYVMPKDNLLVDAVLDDFSLVLPKAQWKRYKNRAPDASCGAEEEENERIDGDDVGPSSPEPHHQGRGDVDGGESATPSVLPGAVVHRWVDPTLPAAKSIAAPHTVGYLGALIRRTFLLICPQGRSVATHAAAASDLVDDDSGDDDAPSNPPASTTHFHADMHLKMMSHHVVWLAPLADAAHVDTPFKTTRNQTKLSVVARIEATRSAVEHLQNQLPQERVFAALHTLRAVSQDTGLLELDRRIYQCDVDSGRMRQKEGATNEANVWLQYEDKIISQVVLPIHDDIVGHHHHHHHHHTSSGVAHARSAPAVALSAKYAPEMWVRKCFAMALSDEEETIVRAHPTYDEAQFKEEEALFLSRGQTDLWDLRRRYFMFVIFATHCVQLPFYHLVDESALALFDKVIPTAKQLQSDPEAAALGWVWKPVGELDGMLVDLNTNDVLACFEIKANPADIGKAALQGIRFSELLEQAFRPATVTVPLAVPATGGGAVAPPAPAIQHNVRVHPRSAPHYSKPYYDNVFPLTSDNFRRYFSDAAQRPYRWYIVANLPAAVDPPPRNGRGGTAAQQLPCAAPPFILPSQGRSRHYVVDAMAQLLAQSTNTSSSATDGERAPRTLDMRCAGAMANRLSAQIYGKPSPEPSPEDVIKELSATRRCSNIVWLERKPTEESSL